MEAKEKEIFDNFVKALKGIPDINVEAGLSHFSGIENIYYQEVSLFRKKLVAECDKMSALLECKDWKSFVVAVHSMKTSLATLGMITLSNMAAKLEAAARNENIDYCSEHFPILNKNLLSLHEQLSIAFPDEGVLQ